MSVIIDQLSVTYRGEDHFLLAVDRVSMQLQPGRITALVGESGSGKTTLGKSLMGLLPDNAVISGHIRFNGEELLGFDEERLQAMRGAEMAMVFQNRAENFNPVQHIIDQVAEPLIQHRKMKRAEARNRAGEALQKIGLSQEIGARYPHELSGGQAQLALIAMALILDPGVLILDEPTAALDAVTKNSIAGIIKTLRRAGKSILLITHDLDLAKSLADDLAILYLGRIMETLPARDLLVNPRHPYTLALGRSYPSLDTLRDLGGIRGDAFYRQIHAHAVEGDSAHTHTHISAPGSTPENGHAPVSGCLFWPRCTQAEPACRQKEVPFLEIEQHQVRCLRGGIVDLLVLKRVEKKYGEIQALSPTDLNLRAGEVFCLVGETGSGKTTLAMIAAGALNPDSGERLFEGRDMDQWLKQDYRSLAPRMGVIYQNPSESVSHRFSVFDIVAEPLKIIRRGLSDAQIRERVIQALTDVRLSTEPAFLKRYPHELNMGAIQRLCMARALINEPILIVADEPTSSLDPSVQAKLLKLLLNLQIEKGLTLLFVTHDIGLARKIGDRIGVMQTGKMVEFGPASQVLSSPQHSYTQHLITSAKGIFK